MVARRVDESAGRGRRDEFVGGGPGFAGGEAASVDLGSVSAKLLDQRSGEHDGPLGGLGLRLDQEQAASGAARALGAALPAARRRTLDRRAPVLPGVALDGAADAEDA